MSVSPRGPVCHENLAPDRDSIRGPHGATTSSSLAHLSIVQRGDPPVRTRTGPTGDGSLRSWDCPGPLGRVKTAIRRFAVLTRPGALPVLATTGATRIPYSRAFTDHSSVVRLLWRRGCTKRRTYTRLACQTGWCISLSVPLLNAASRVARTPRQIWLQRRRRGPPALPEALAFAAESAPQRVWDFGANSRRRLRPKPPKHPTPRPRHN
jgi:hypothetical protein